MDRADDRLRSVAARLKVARETAGLSQGQAAGQLGMHRPTISEIEAGRRKVSAEELNLFASLYSVTVSWLVGEATEMVEASDPRIKLIARRMDRLKEADLDALLRVISTFIDGNGRRA